jgi:hypothetical protein
VTHVHAYIYVYINFDTGRRPHSVLRLELRLAQLRIPPALLELLVHARLLEDRPATVRSNHLKKVRWSIYMCVYVNETEGDKIKP